MQLERLCGLQRVLGFSLAATAKSAKPKAAATPVREPLRQEGHLHRKQFLLLERLWCLPGVLPVAPISSALATTVTAFAAPSLAKAVTAALTELALHRARSSDVVGVFLCRFQHSCDLLWLSGPFRGRRQVPRGLRGRPTVWLHVVVANFRLVQADQGLHSGMPQGGRSLRR